MKDKTKKNILIFGAYLTGTIQTSTNFLADGNVTVMSITSTIGIAILVILSQL